MPPKLKLASFYTLALLSGMLFAILLALFYFLRYINIGVMIGLTLLFNFLIWLAAPYLIDFSHRLLYKMRFLEKEEFEKEYPELSKFIEITCQKHRIPFPKMRVVEDANPTAYTYGSGAFNARIAFSKGLLQYLNQKEVEAVIAHEIGHIIHRDFIVMSIANTILQLLYQLYVIFLRGTKGGKKKGAAAIFGAISYLFYLIGTYIVLYLSRIREYYADSFSARETKNPELLSKALIKIAYGILTFKKEGTHLIKSTKTLGILGINDAKTLGPLIKEGEFEPAKISKILLFDLVNPWASFLELSATHPLVGKRLRALDEQAKIQGKNPLFDIDKYLRETPIDKNRLWKNFFQDCFFYYMPYYLSIVWLVFVALKGDYRLLILYPVFLGIGIFVRTLYRFPKRKEIPNTSVFELMSDIYASPARGKRVKLQGKVVGRGIPGYYFSEDLMYQDQTGLIYLNYQSAIPFVGNILFALSKVKRLIGVEAAAVGWFLRGNTKMLTLENLKTSTGLIRSYPRLYYFLIAIFFILIPLIFLPAV
jgi:Zn-dependent protease with chaperone function